MRFVCRIVLLVVLLSCSVGKVSAQIYAVRVNGLALLTGTINAGFDVGLGKKTSWDFSVYGNPITSKGLSLEMVGAQTGPRFWLVEPNIGHFFGVQVMATGYNLANKNFTLKGVGAGVGFSYGYSHYLAKRVNLSFEIGIGALYLADTKTPKFTPHTEDEYIYHSRRIAIAPTRAEISIVYLF